MNISLSDFTSNSKLDAGFYYTENEDRDWYRSIQLSGLEAESFFGLTVHPENQDQLAILTDRGIFESKDAGATVTLFEETEGTSATLYTENQFYLVKNQTLFSLEGERGVIPLEELVLYLAVNPSNPDQIYAVTGDGTAAVTEDGGINWLKEEIIPSE